MSATIILGAQWGDEGKGKIVDVLSKNSNLVIRHQAGANAGHTLKVGDKKTILHLIPSGILYPHITCLIGPAVLLDLETIMEEIDEMTKQGYMTRPDQLLISSECTLVMPYHKKLDQAREKKAGDSKIGTTGKGIGPAVEDRASRQALILGDIFDSSFCLKKALEEKNFLLEKFYGEKPFEEKGLLELVEKAKKKLKPHLLYNSSHYVYEKISQNKKVLFEGAQGTLIDLHHGTYPFVTSSSTLSGAVCTGMGIGPRFISKVLGIMKAYTTRVGEGPFPTELINDEVGNYLQEKGAERGATTNRIRRCGWLDLVALKHSFRINGFHELIVTKIDVLTGLKTLKVCTEYEIDGKKTSVFPNYLHTLKKAKPIYQELKGWDEDISSVQTFEKLPNNAQEYLRFIQKELNCPVSMISVGPERSKTFSCSF